MVKKSGKSKRNSGSQMEAAVKGAASMFGEELGLDDFDEDGFIEGDINSDDAVAVFSFGMSSNLSNSPEDTELQSTATRPSSESTKSNEPNRGAIKGLTPPIDGEQFSLKRGHQFRPSTIRKLNELKNKHPDINVYLNTVLDAAILHYYNYIFNENGEF